MVYAGPGSNALNAELIDTNMKALSEMFFTLKPLVTNISQASDTYSYFRKSNVILSASTNLAPGSAFPHGNMVYEKNTANATQYNLAQDIFAHDIKTNRIDVFMDAQTELTKAVTKAVEDDIVDQLNTLPITFVAQLSGWASATRVERRPEEDLGRAIELISLNFKQKPTHVVCNPTTARYLLQSNSFKGDAQSDAVNTGNASGVGSISQQGNFNVMGYIKNPGLTVITSTRVPTGRAIVVNLKNAVTWFESEPFTTSQEEVPGEYVRLKAWNIGKAVLVDPLAGVIITSTNS